MFPDGRFSDRDREFWSYVRLISEQAGYQPRGEEIIKEYTTEDIQKTVEKTGINGGPLFGDFTSDGLTELGDNLLEYLNFRSHKVEEAMDGIRTREEAVDDFEEYIGDYELDHFQTNKQGDDKPLVFANTVNAVIEKEYGTQFDPDPYKLPTALDDDKKLQMTFAKRLDGAVPHNRNPIAIWEVKEFYNSSTFGSRVADAIYEMMLISQEEGMLREETGREIELYLMTDGWTAWKKGVSYICRIIDILNMGYIDGAIFGDDVLDDWIQVVKGWEEEEVVLPSE